MAQATLCLCFVLGFEALRFVNGRLLDGMAGVPTNSFAGATMKSPQGPESLAYREQNHGRSSPNNAARGDAAQIGSAELLPSAPRTFLDAHAGKTGARAWLAERAHYSTEEAVEWIGKGGR